MRLKQLDLQVSISGWQLDSSCDGRSSPRIHTNSTLNLPDSTVAFDSSASSSAVVSQCLSLSRAIMDGFVVCSSYPSIPEWHVQSAASTCESTRNKSAASPEPDFSWIKHTYDANIWSVTSVSAYSSTSAWQLPLCTYNKDDVSCHQASRQGHGEKTYDGGSNWRVSDLLEPQSSRIAVQACSSHQWQTHYTAPSGGEAWQSSTCKNHCLMLQIAQNERNELPCALKLQFWGHNSLAEQ